MYMKFQKILMTGWRDMDKKHQKWPKNEGFPPFATPQDFFFKNRALSLLYPYGALTSCRKLEKSLERSLEIFEDRRTTDGPTDHGHGWLHRTSLGKPGVQNETWYQKCIQSNCSSDLLKQLKTMIAISYKSSFALKGDEYSKNDVTNDAIGWKQDIISRKCLL